jgi:hypothetical protein
MEGIRVGMTLRQAEAIIERVDGILGPAGELQVAEFPGLSVHLYRMEWSPLDRIPFWLGGVPPTHATHILVFVEGRLREHLRELTTHGWLP